MFRTAVKKDKLELYKLHHQMVWEAVENGLRGAGISLLTIWAPKDGGNVLQMYIECDKVLSEVTGPGTVDEFLSNYLFLNSCRILNSVI